MATLTPEQFKKQYGEQTYNSFPQSQSLQTVNKETFGSRLKEDISQGRQKIADIQNSDASGFTKVAQQAAVVTGLPLKAAKEALPEFARTGIEKVGEVIGQGVGALSNKISDIPAVQQWASSLPEDKFKKITDVLAGTAAVGETAGNVATMYAGVKGAVDLGEKTGQVISKGVQEVKQGVTEIKDTLQPKLQKIFGDQADQLRKTNLKLSPLQVEKLGSKVDDVIKYLKDNKVSGSPAEQFKTVSESYKAAESNIQKVIADSGKLYNKTNLIEELKKLPDQYATQFDDPAVYNQLIKQNNQLIKYVSEKMSEEIPAAKINAFKRTYAAKGFNKGGDMVVSEANLALSDALYNTLLKDIPTLKPLNKAYSTIIITRKVLGKALGRNELGLMGKIVSSAAGGALGSVVGGPLGTGAGIVIGPKLAGKFAGTAARTKIAQTLENMSK